MHLYRRDLDLFTGGRYMHTLNGIQIACLIFYESGQQPQN